MASGRRSSASVGAAFAIALTMAVVVCATVSAHRLDEYLQVARIGVDPGRVEFELDLTPGMAVADAIIADIDRDGDGALSAGERHAYAARVLSGVQLLSDGRPLQVQPLDSSFPDFDLVRRGEGLIRLRADARVPPLPEGAHQLYFRNAHRDDVSVYLANALVPATERIAITAQRRDGDQRELTIEYMLRPEPALSTRQLKLGSVIGVAAVASLLMRRSRAA